MKNESKYYEMPISELKTMFLDGTVRVVFEKKDGSSRELIGTLNQHFFPAVNVKDDADGQPKERRNAPAQNQTHIRVYEPAVSDWRIVNAAKLLEKPVMIEFAPSDAEIDAAAADEENYESLEEALAGGK